ncbi:carboxypeptidase regulatory-like domain-containing protein [Nocardioides bruguierae]|uniref:Carboxypeptidase regulatory-like domain-containing protein n=1 Tax=Nocardioides bruguierae TaxID=2945102 RepID=A0A9X2IF60_9ACTN|nr:carboxypeptidase regulatory-like domain-containing protein [Nocardioides bruguierae]MCM0621516.1 carboxypeptidase regulatory-like domain-containing protein [Nocardioides bruguierae]
MTRLRRALAAVTAVSVTAVGGFAFTTHSATAAGGSVTSAQAEVAAADTKISGYLVDPQTLEYLDDVFIVAKQGGEIVATALSYGADGFELWVPAGVTKVEVKDPDYIDVTRTFDTTTGNKTGVTIFLNRARYLAGYVTDDVGNPLLDASVVAVTGGQTVASQLTYTDGDDVDGFFNLEVPAGRYKVVVDAGDGYYPRVDTGVQVTEASSGVPGDYTVHRRSSVSGVVSDGLGEVAGASVVLTARADDSPTPEVTATSKRNGSWSADLAAGKYTWKVTKRGYPAERGTLAVGGRPATQDVLLTTTLPTRTSLEGPGRLRPRKQIELDIDVAAKGATPTGKVRVVAPALDVDEVVVLRRGAATLTLPKPRDLDRVVVKAVYGGSTKPGLVLQGSSARLVLTR